jgi:hypothetical protein
VSTIDIMGKGVLELCDGYLQLRWRSGQTIGVDESHRAVSAIETLGHGSSLPMLIQVEGVTFTREARKVFPSPGSVSRIALLGSSPVDYAIALFVLRVSPLPCPVAYFTSPTKAMTWLREEHPRRRARSQ